MITNREMVLIAIVAFLLGLLACQAFSPPVKTAVAQIEPVVGQKFLQKCEYGYKKYVDKGGPQEQEINDYLNLQAQSGWKLVSVSLDEVGTLVSPYFCFVKEL